MPELCDMYCGISRTNNIRVVTNNMPYITTSLKIDVTAYFPLKILADGLLCEKFAPCKIYECSTDRATILCKFTQHFCVAVETLQ